MRKMREAMRLRKREKFRILKIKFIRKTHGLKKIQKNEYRSVMNHELTNLMKEENMVIYVHKGPMIEVIRYYSNKRP